MIGVPASGLSAVPAVTARQNYRILGSQLGAVYGTPTAAGVEAARLAARHDGLLLDHSCTAKAMAGLIQGIRGGTYPHRDRVCSSTPGGWRDSSQPAAAPAHSS